MKISKRMQSLHKNALDLIDEAQTRLLNEDEREFVIENFYEGAQHMNALAGAFFTPLGLAQDFSIHVAKGERILDLCAGIGRLSWPCSFPDYGDKKRSEITCVELNPDYVRVGKAAIPSARWICADVFDLDYSEIRLLNRDLYCANLRLEALMRYSFASGNPPTSC